MGLEKTRGKSPAYGNLGENNSGPDAGKPERKSFAYKGLALEKLEQQIERQVSCGMGLAPGGNAPKVSHSNGRFLS